MKYVYISIAVIVLLVGTLATVKKVSPVSWGWWGTTNTSSGVALHGHDPVVYFDEATAKLGNANYSHVWADATWHFQDVENRDRFAANPEMYSPQYGSFCAFAMSIGFTAEIDADAWHIENGRLYVFADKNVRDDWVEGLPDGSLEASEESWSRR